MRLEPYIYRVRRLMHSKDILQFCKSPYPGHAKGCPKKVGACNGGNYITDVLDVDQDMWLVHSEFDLMAHVERLRVVHPDWSERQLRCVLYWQGTSRKQLRERVVIAMKVTKANFVTFVPEGLGVNVFKTAIFSNLKLDPIRNIKICRHIALIGQKARG